MRVFAFSGAQRGRITALEGLTSGGSTREIQHILFQLLDFSACAPGVSVAVMRLARGQCVISSCILGATVVPREIEAPPPLP